MKRLLWVGDAGCSTGFARATHETLNILSKNWDISVLGINYFGDPHVRDQFPYPIYPALPGGDVFGVGRFIWMCDKVQPDVIVLQHDPWNIKPYMTLLKEFPEHSNIPVIASIAVDGKNCQGDLMNDLSLGIFWTKFALEEAKLGGFTQPGIVVPLGVDTKIYQPQNQHKSRRELLPEKVWDKFLIGNVNRNQVRKRWDLTIRYFAEWVKKYGIEDAYLCLHVAPTNDRGFDIVRLSKYYGIADNVLLLEGSDLSEPMMAKLYSCFDIQISTTQGEGFGLTTIESMACGVPQIAPDWSGLGDWARGGAVLIPCTSTAATVGLRTPSAVIGGVPDEHEFIEMMQHLYLNPDVRRKCSDLALAKAQEPQFRWENIGQAFDKALNAVLATVTV